MAPICADVPIVLGATPIDWPWPLGYFCNVTSKADRFRCTRGAGAIDICTVGCRGEMLLVLFISADQKSVSDSKSSTDLYWDVIDLVESWGGQIHGGGSPLWKSESPRS